MTVSRWLILGALFGGLAVGLGAFGAHVLDRAFAEMYQGHTGLVAGQAVPLSAKYMGIFKTGAEYQMYHSLALMVVGMLAQHRSSIALNVAGISFVLGIVLFSGSLYVLTLTGNTKWGMVTPVGGVAFLVGWSALVVAAVLGTPRDNFKRQ